MSVRGRERKKEKTEPRKNTYSLFLKRKASGKGDSIRRRERGSRNEKRR